MYAVCILNKEQALFSKKIKIPCTLFNKLRDFIFDYYLNNSIAKRKENECSTYICMYVCITPVNNNDANINVKTIFAHLVMRTTWEPLL